MTNIEFIPSRRHVLAGGAGLGMLALLTACGVQGSSSDGSSGSTDQLIVAWPVDADSLDPQNSSYSFEDWDLCCNLYETLVSPKFVPNGDGVMVWDGLTIAPELAASYTTKGDIATFYLDKTRKFYPTGNPVTADDVVYSMQRLFGLQQQSSLNTAGIFSMDQIKKVDDYTVEMKFTDTDGQPIEVNGFQLAVFRWPNLPVLDSVEVKKHVTSSDPTGTNWLKTNTAGTGPYYVKSRTIGQQIDLAAVPGNPRNPAYKNVTITVAGNVLSLLKGGSANLAVYGLTQEDVDSLASDSALQALYSKAPEFFMLQMGTDAGGPFANELVRQAVAYTIPYDQIITSLFAGQTTKDLSVVTTGANGYYPAWAQYTTNIDKAKELMSRAGNPKVSAPLHFLNDDPTTVSMAILIQSSAAQAGIEFVLNPMTPAAETALTTARAMTGKGSPDALLYKWGVWMDDPSITIGYFFTKGGVSNYPLWSDPRVDAISNEWFGKPASAQRAAAYEEAQKIIAEAAPIIPIVHADRVIVTAKGMTGVTISPEMCMRYWPLKPSAA
ncbi:MAG TPA: ABC transporter substrate-binding protein [Mycobacteriales bacterium]|nr:ABC transporter substrate-binding protein [Mycobacteriales bacterium]